MFIISPFRSCNHKEKIFIDDCHHVNEKEHGEEHVEDVSENQNEEPSNEEIETSEEQVEEKVVNKEEVVEGNITDEAKINKTTDNEVTEELTEP